MGFQASLQQELVCNPAADIKCQPRCLRPWSIPYSIHILLPEVWVPWWRLLPCSPPPGLKLSSVDAGIPSLRLSLFTCHQAITSAL